MHKSRMRLPSDKLVRAAQFKVPANCEKLDSRTPDQQFAALRVSLARIDMRLEKARKAGADTSKLLDLRGKTVSNMQRVATELAKWQEGAQAQSDRVNKG